MALPVSANTLKPVPHSISSSQRYRADGVTDILVEGFPTPDAAIRMVSRNATCVVDWSMESGAMTISATSKGGQQPATLEIANFMVVNRSVGKLTMTDAAYRREIEPSLNGPGPSESGFPHEDQPNSSTLSPNVIQWEMASDTLSISINSPTTIRLPAAPPAVSQ